MLAHQKAAKPLARAKELAQPSLSSLGASQSTATQGPCSAFATPMVRLHVTRLFRQALYCIAYLNHFKCRHWEFCAPCGVLLAVYSLNSITAASALTLGASARRSMCSTCLTFSVFEIRPCCSYPTEMPARLLISCSAIALMHDPASALCRRHPHRQQICQG